MSKFKLSSLLILSMLMLPLCLVTAACSNTDTAANNASAGREQAANSGSESSTSNNGPAAATRPGSALEIGDPAPDFGFETVNGTQGMLSDYRGQVVLLNQWASWCKPCLNEMPDLNQIQLDYPQVAVLAVNVSDDQKDALGYIEQNDYSLTWILDSSGAISSLYPTDGIPYTVIIDAEGVVSEIFLGSGPEMYNSFKDAIVKASSPA